MGELQAPACINQPGTGLRIGIANIGRVKRDVSVQIETAPDGWQVARYAALTENDGIQDATRDRASMAGNAVLLPRLDEGLTMLELVTTEQKRQEK